MTDLPAARAVSRHHHGALADTVALDYESRFLRRRRLVTASGASLMVDLAETTSLDHGDALLLEDGRAVGVVAAAEHLVEVRGDLPRLAWHVGNRHTPCQITADRLVIRRDHVIEAMLRQLGAELTPVHVPFRPEGGAYGHGRTMGHDHAPSQHDHSDTHDHAHSH